MNIQPRNIPNFQQSPDQQELSQQFPQDLLQRSQQDMINKQPDELKSINSKDEVEKKDVMKKLQELQNDDYETKITSQDNFELQNNSLNVSNEQRLNQLSTKDTQHKNKFFENSDKNMSLENEENKRSKELQSMNFDKNYTDVSNFNQMITVMKIIQPIIQII